MSDEVPDVEDEEEYDINVTNQQAGDVTAGPEPNIPNRDVYPRNSQEDNKLANRGVSETTTQQRGMAFTDLGRILLRIQMYPLSLMRSSVLRATSWTMSE